MKKLITSLILLASSVAMAKTVLVHSSIPLQPSSVEANTKANITHSVDRLNAAEKTLEVAMPDCNETVLTNHLLHRIKMANVKFVNEIAAPHASHYAKLVGYFIYLSDDKTRIVSSKAHWYRMTMFSVKGHRPINEEDIAKFKLAEPHTPVVSTLTPLTMVCQGIFASPLGDKVTIRFDITRDPVTNKKTAVGPDDVDETLAAITKMTRLKSVLPGYNEVMGWLLNYNHDKCGAYCLTPKLATVAVDFMIGELTPTQAIKAGLRYPE